MKKKITKADISRALDRANQYNWNARCGFTLILKLVGEGSIGHPAKEIMKICKKGLK
jgi:hypothetical protein